jgi:hypothetical protein
MVITNAGYRERDWYKEGRTIIESVNIDGQVVEDYKALKVEMGRYDLKETENNTKSVGLITKNQPFKVGYVLLFLV